MLLDAGSYVQDVFEYVNVGAELVDVVEAAVQDAQVVPDEVVLVVFDAGSVDVAEPQLQAVPPAEIVPAPLPSPPMGGARRED
jgi:hypothetical protein